MDNNNKNPNEDGATVDQQIREKDDAVFASELKELQAKHKRVLVPIINTSRFGIFPSLKVVTEDEYKDLMGRLGFSPTTADTASEEPKG